MTRLAVGAGTTRPGGRSRTVADWVVELGAQHADVASGDASLAVFDVVEVALPLMDESSPAAFGHYENPHTRRWAATVAGFDGFVSVTPE